MRAVDTNVLARFILRDDEHQWAQALEILREPVWVSTSVFLELGWVLGRRLAMDRAVVADALTTLLTLDTVHTADRDDLMWAVERFAAGADWADMVHLVSARGKAQSFVTFDRGVARAAGTASPVPVEALP